MACSTRTSFLFCFETEGPKNHHNLYFFRARGTEESSHTEQTTQSIRVKKLRVFYYALNLICCTPWCNARGHTVQPKEQIILLLAVIKSVLFLIRKKTERSRNKKERKTAKRWLEADFVVALRRWETEEREAGKGRGGERFGRDRDRRPVCASASGAWCAGANPSGASGPKATAAPASLSLM